MQPPQRTDRDKCTSWLKHNVAVMKLNQSIIFLCFVLVHFNRDYSFGFPLMVNVCEWEESANLVRQSPLILNGEHQRQNPRFDSNLTTQFIIMFMSMGAILSQSSFFSPSACVPVCLLPLCSFISQLSTVFSSVVYSLSLLSLLYLFSSFTCICNMKTFSPEALPFKSIGKFASKGVSRHWHRHNFSSINTIKF